MSDRILYDDGAVSVRCVDTPDPVAGGACHEYIVQGPQGTVLGTVNFQHGPVQAHGFNGVQHVHLLRIIEDRLRHFQAGPFASTLNEIALSGVQTALAADQERTARRVLAGVEGQNKKAASVER